MAVAGAENAASMSSGARSVTERIPAKPAYPYNKRFAQPEKESRFGPGLEVPA
jgi:hypothetical protein